MSSVHSVQPAKRSGNQLVWTLICAGAIACAASSANAQQQTILCGYSSDQGGFILGQFSFNPGQTYTDSIFTGPLTSSGCIGLEVGGADAADITISSLTYAGPQELTFTITVGANAPLGQDVIDLYIGNAPNGGIYPIAYWKLSVEPPPPPRPPGPPAPLGCPMPVIQSVSRSQWQAGAAVPITISGVGFNCVTSSQVSATPTEASSSISLTVLSIAPTVIKAVVQPAATDPKQAACIAITSPVVVLTVGNFDTAANPSPPMTVGAPCIPLGGETALPETSYTAEIVNAAAIVTDTSKIMNGVVTVQLNGVAGETGDLTLNLWSSSGKERTITFSAETVGTHDLHLPLNTIQPDTYNMLDGTWNASLGGASFPATIPDYEMPTLWQYFRQVRFSQYNTPYENECSAAQGQAYIVSAVRSSTGYTCTLTPISLSQSFITQTWINGTGVSQHYGILKNAAADPRKLGSAQNCAGQYPQGAKGSGAKGGNAFTKTTTISGSCGVLQDQVSAAVPEIGGTRVKLSGVTTLPCNYTVNMTSGDYKTDATRTAADLCPFCGDPNNNGVSNNGHIDSYTKDTACSAHHFGDLPSSPYFSSNETDH